MDADKMLAEVRRAVERVYVAPEPQSAEGQRVMRHLVAVADYFRQLDSHLSAGGKPPAAWSEGPDEPYMDEPGTLVTADQVAAARAALSPSCPHPTVVMGRCDDCGAYPHGHYGVEPLGGPIPGVAGSHLPEHPEQGCVRCGNQIAWYGDAWAHKYPGHGDHPATAATWPGSAIANDEPGR